MSVLQESTVDQDGNSTDSQPVEGVDKELDSGRKIPQKKKKASSKKKKASAKKSIRKKKVKPEYNVDYHPETGVMVLQELYYYRLINAEQRIKILDRDLQLAKLGARDFQTQANIQLQALQDKTREVSNSLNTARAEYVAEVKLVEDATGLSLKDWTIDDERVLRPIEKQPSK